MFIEKLKFMKQLAEMKITAVPTVNDDCLMIKEHIVFTQVPSNLILTSLANEAAFIGASSPNSSSRHVFSCGVLEGYKFMCLFRFKIWWMIPGFGESGCEVPAETQMLLLETKEKSTLQNGISDQPISENSFYILLLPVLDGPFRASLQGNTVSELEFCVESGDPNVQTSQVTEAVFLNSGDNPFKLIRNSIKMLAKHKGTFNHVDNKKIPAHVDWFGWSTWNAFYHEVDPQGIELRLKSLSEGACPPKCLYIDEGWQTKVIEVEEETEPPDHGKFVARLASIQENEKFRSSHSGNSYANLREFVKTIKEKFGLK